MVAGAGISSPALFPHPCASSSYAPTSKGYPFCAYGSLGSSTARIASHCLWSETVAPVFWRRGGRAPSSTGHRQDPQVSMSFLATQARRRDPCAHPHPRPSKWAALLLGSARRFDPAPQNRPQDTICLLLGRSESPDWSRVSRQIVLDLDEPGCAGWHERENLQRSMRPPQSKTRKLALRATRNAGGGKSDIDGARAVGSVSVWSGAMDLHAMPGANR